MNTIINPPKSQWPGILKRPEVKQESLISKVESIIHEVKINGDKALKRFTQKFDHWDAEELLLTEEEKKKALEAVDVDLRNAINLAKGNIEKFHRSQIEREKKVETIFGVQCWRKSIAVEKVGLYIPGGSAPLLSTLLMLAIPARIAGCKQITVCSPAIHGNLHPGLIYILSELKINSVYKVGGAQAIAAMAYGTESINPVDKIFGPGNNYVTKAKQIVSFSGTAIDLPAGPSELAVYADDTAIPQFVAADLLSQAEHGADSQVILVTTNEDVLHKVKKEIEIQKLELTRQRQIDGSLKNSKLICLPDVNDCFHLLNEYAPEHLILASDFADKLVEKVINAGSVFLGNYSPESAGDYVSGTNHTLPTNGFARSYSGVSLDSFLKKITFQKLSREGLLNVGKAIEDLATAEGLDAHKNAVSIRVKRK